MDVIIFFLLDAAATLDVLTASNDDVKLNENRTVRFSSLKLSSPFEKINKSTGTTRIGKCHHLFAPWEMNPRFWHDVTAAILVSQNRE